MTTADSKAGEGAAPTSEQELTAEIERTREELGATVEALAAKTDIKARIRAAMSRLAVTTRKRRGPLAVAAGAAALGSIAAVIARWRRR